MSSGCRARATILMTSASCASISWKMASSPAVSGVPEKSCQERIILASPRRCVSSRRQAGSAASSRSRKSAPRARASSRRARRSASRPDQRPPSAASRLVAMTGPGWLRKSRFRSGCLRKSRRSSVHRPLRAARRYLDRARLVLASTTGTQRRRTVSGFRFAVFGGQA